MDLVKTFVTGDQTWDINIQGTTQEPLFQASQIGKLLDIKNIREALSHFNESQKVVSI